MPIPKKRMATKGTHGWESGLPWPCEDPKGSSKGHRRTLWPSLIITFLSACLKKGPRTQDFSASKKLNRLPPYFLDSENLG